MKQFLNLMFCVFCLFGCNSKSVQKKGDEITTYSIDFNKPSDLKYFKAETEIGTQEVSLKDGMLDIDAVKGATVWFREKLTAPVKIEYLAQVVDKGGANDRVSDLNCFFMAIDPRCPDDIFSCDDSIRTGDFGTYHSLRTYYVGYGGNNNATTRMRRYPGYTRERPILPEHDLGWPHVIKPNRPIKIEIIVVGNKITYLQDHKVVFEMDDKLPYHEGWFAFRTVRNHMQVLDFQVTKMNNYSKNLSL